MDKHDPRYLRGARSFVQGRFESVEREAFDDGWTPEERGTEELKTTVTIERARSIISRNDSPDIGFSQSINPYRGCEHGCIYCMAGNTRILTADGGTKALADLRAGDVLYGTLQRGRYRHYVKSRVLAHWSVIKPAYRTTLEDGTQLVAGPDHRFLTERGWKFVTGAEQGRARRPHLTTSNRLVGVGGFASTPAKDKDYRLGYLCGLIRVKLGDVEALLRAQDYLQHWQIDRQRMVFRKAALGRRLLHAVRAQALPDVGEIRALVAWPASPSRAWSAGFLAGIFDAEGGYHDGVLRIRNTDDEIVGWTARSLSALGFGFVIENPYVRIRGGLREHLRFFHGTDPAIVRKRDIAGQAVKSAASLRVVDIEPLGKAARLYDITTETGDFIANGVVSHNCYARPSHAYLELSPGLDFETKLFAKTNAAELLKNELSKPGYRPSPIALGANTDCYQPIERKYRITRQILEVLAECDHPVTMVTKSALIERDLDLLAPMAGKNLVKVFVSIGTLDRGLARKLEPRAASPQRRLDVVKALNENRIPCGVMVAALIPALNDKTMEHVLEAAVAAGARQAAYVVMRLPHELKTLFKEWLAEHYPERAEHVMSIVRQMRGGRENDPNFGTRMSGTGNYAELIAKRFDIACRRLGINSEESPELDCSRFRPPSPSGQLQLL